MIFVRGLLLGISFTGNAAAHYSFGRLILNSRWTGPWEYVREVAPDPNTDPGSALQAPLRDINSIDLRCGRNASLPLTLVKTAAVRAGDTVGFGLGPISLGWDPVIFHPGPASAWLSRSPVDDLNTYSGDGDWFKILSVTGRTAQSLNYSDPAFNATYSPAWSIWGTYSVESWNFTIPKTTPSGRYLLRFEHLFPDPRTPQFFVNCAHLDIVNSNDVGTPHPLVKIPGVYTVNETDVYFYPASITVNITTYYQQPAIWAG